MNECFESIDGVCVIVDDVLVHGRTRREHDQNLRKVMVRAQERGVMFSEDKMEVGVTEVQYFGHTMSSEGVEPDPSKINAIRDMEAPRNRAELETVLGMVKYLAKFAPNLAEVTAPLRQLPTKDAEFVWDYHQAQAFEHVKDILTHSPGT